MLITPRGPAHTDSEVIVDKVSVPSSKPSSTVDEEIRKDAAAHPERSYSEHVEAARRIAAPSYREEIRRLMAAGTSDPEEENA